MSNILSQASAKFAPIPTGRQVVKFGPDLLRYVAEHGEFPCFRDALGDYMYIQLSFKNGAKTTGIADRENRGQFGDCIKLRFHGKFDGDFWEFKRWSAELRKLDKAYAYMPVEEILQDLLSKEFPVYISYSESGKYRYIQLSWSQAEYNRRVGKPAAKKAAAAKSKAVEEDLPFELDF